MEAYKREKLLFYVSNNFAKTCSYGFRDSSNFKIKDLFHFFRNFMYMTHFKQIAYVPLISLTFLKEWFENFLTILWMAFILTLFNFTFYRSLTFFQTKHYPTHTPHLSPYNQLVFQK